MRPCTPPTCATDKSKLITRREIKTADTIPHTKITWVRSWHQYWHHYWPQYWNHSSHLPSNTPGMLHGVDVSKAVHADEELSHRCSRFSGRSTATTWWLWIKYSFKGGECQGGGGVYEHQRKGWLVSITRLVLVVTKWMVDPPPGSIHVLTLLMAIYEGFESMLMSTGNSTAGWGVI